jgi:AcrR family transcriptional regulator
MPKSPAPKAAAPPSRDRERAVEALMDAAERLLVSEGHAKLSTRRVAQEAQVNHGLVHYYFGSMEELLMQVLERFTAALIERQREMYAAEGPFIEKWRTAWRYHEEDLAAGYPKIWFELQAMAWNEPRLRERLAAINEEWRAVIGEALQRARGELPGPMPGADALTALVMMLAQGAQLERLLGIDRGHGELLTWIDEWLDGGGGA